MREDMPRLSAVPAADKGHTELLGKLSAKSLSKGVRIEVQDNVVAVRIALSIAFGYSIPDVSRKVQEKVKSAIENMTGLEVSDVNVSITGIETEKK